MATVNGLRSLTGLRPLYFLPNEPLVEEVLIPAFRRAQAADCMMGFFSSSALSALAPGLATYINSSNAPLRLVVSPHLRDDDVKAMLDRGETLEEIAAKALMPLLVSEDLLQRHTLACLSYLVRHDRLRIKVVMLDGALFHPKVWLFSQERDQLAVHGSSNMTAAGIRSNFEQISVSASWVDKTQETIASKLSSQFERLWSNEEKGCRVFDLPTAVRDGLVRTYSLDRPPTELEFFNLWRSPLRANEPTAASRPGFQLPSGVGSASGPFAHQRNAVSAWAQAGFRGVLEMATGSGKTITSMLGAYELARQESPLLIVIAAPYVPLMDQWCDEVKAFGLIPVNLSASAGATARRRQLQAASRRLRTGVTRVEAAIVSHDTLCTPDFGAAVAECNGARLLIADEAHNLGRRSFIESPPEFYEFRLALSATPVRQYDPDGTAKLFDFFGPVVFQFTLADAIGKCLVEYDYHVHQCELGKIEMEEWETLSLSLRKSAWRLERDPGDELVAKILRERRLLLETAESKLTRLQSLMERGNIRQIQHTLIYATDKAPGQLDQVNRLLSRHGVLFHQLTAEETSDRAKTRSIIKSFQDGDIQVLTAKRVLDEGVNIPQIRCAYVLASTTVERQWVQRRGRLLRICPEIGKTHGVIHDFFVVPPDVDGSLNADERALLRGELARMQEFASLARNAGREDGALETIHRIVKLTMM